jgi:hypothetical protein
MESWKRWLFLVAGLAAAAVVASSIVQAVRSGSWGPVITTAWVPAAVIAAWPTAGRRCLTRRSGQARRADLRR